MSKKILFIEDEEDFARITASYLKRKGFAVTHTASGRSGFQKLQKKPYDLVILDLGLPDKDGLELCKKIREKYGVLILILTARDSIGDKVKGLNLGADDYLVKPVSVKELEARINRLLKRNLKGTFHSSIFQFNKIKFNTVTGRLASGKKSAQLTEKERAVLEYLLLMKNRVLTRIEIMDHVWGEEINLFSNSVNMTISSIRKKLRTLSKNQFIHTIHGLGYKFEWKKNNG